MSFSKCIRILPCGPHSETVGFVGFAQPTGYHCSLLVAFSLLQLKGYRDSALQVLEFDADAEQNMVTGAKPTASYFIGIRVCLGHIFLVFNIFRYLCALTMLCTIHSSKKISCSI